MDRKTKASRLIIASAVLTITMLATNAFAHEFTGTVEVGEEKVPFVAVDILGPRNLFARTNENGEFTISLKTGSYVFRIRYNGRREHFKITVSEDLTYTFRLPAS